MNRKMKLIFILSIIFVLLFLMLPIQVLTVSSHNQLLYTFHMKDHEKFSIRWIHSVEEEEWEEFFYVKEQNIYLDSTRFKTFGAGVPNDVGTNSYIKDGWLYMGGIERFIGELHVRAGDNTYHRLIIKGHIYTLSKKNEEKPYFLKVTKISILKYMYYHFFH